MKSYTGTLIALLFCSVTFGQLTGIKTIPGDYATIVSAVEALNTSGVGGGGVIFDIAAGYIETIAAPIGVTATGTLANPIIFRKSGSGNNPLITAYTGTSTPASAVQDGIWYLSGSDYVTIEGIDLKDPNTANPATMEYGFGLFKAGPADGCQHVTIRNCTVTLNRVNTAAGTAPSMDGSRAVNMINAMVTDQVTELVPADAGGTNSYNQFYGNTFQNCHTGIALSGYAATSPFALGDTGNDIGGTLPATGNTVINFGGGTSAVTPTAGIRVNHQWGINISNNIVNNNNGSGVNHTLTIRGIFLQGGTSANTTIASNQVTVKGGGTSSVMYGIDNGAGSSAAGNTISITGNTVTGSYTTATATSAQYYAIQNTSTASIVDITGNTITGIQHKGAGTLFGISGGSPVSLNITGNLISGLTKTGNGHLIGIKLGTAVNNVSSNIVEGLSCTAVNSDKVIYGTYNFDAATTESFNGNIFRNFSTTGTSLLYGIYCNSVNGNKTITNNQAYNFSTTGNGMMIGIYMNTGLTDVVSNNDVHDFNLTGTTSGVRTLVGIWIGSGTSNAINDNIIQGLTCASGSSGTVYGIYFTAGHTNNTCRNLIRNLSSLSSTPQVYGIYVGSAGTNTNNIYNNYISDLRTPAANSSHPLAGINAAAGAFYNIMYNTIYIDGTSSGAKFGSSALYVSTTPQTVVRNNILVNNTIPKGTGIASAYRRTSTSLSSYLAASNANVYWAGVTEDATHAIFYDETNIYGMTAFKTLVGPSRDSVSERELPPFIQTTATPYDLHLATVVPTACESGALRVTAPFVISTDYDEDIRQGYTGYTGSGTAPDIGADEFNGLPLPLPMTVTVTVATESCHGKCNGTITLGVTGGIPPYTYVWSNGATGPSLTGLCPGTFTVTVNDSGSGQFSGSWTLDPVATLCDTSLVSGTPTGTVCFDAAGVIVVAGANGSFLVQQGASATLIAGASIRYLPGATVEQGGYMLGQIAPSGPFCSASQLPVVIAASEPQAAMIRGPRFRIYPNPSAGVFTVNRMVPGITTPVMLELTDLRGVRAWSGTMDGDRQEFNLAGLTPGLYFLKIRDRETAEILKVVIR